MRLRLSPSLMRKVNQKLDIDLSGTTIAECLSFGKQQYPELVDILWIDQDTLNPQILIFHNNDHIHSGDLQRPVAANDVLDLIPAIEGG